MPAITVLDDWNDEFNITNTLTAEVDQSSDAAEPPSTQMMELSSDGINGDEPLPAAPLFPQLPVRRGASNELVFLRRQAERMKLTPYQKDGLDTFSKANISHQLSLLYLQQCTFENMLTSIITAAAPFQISSALLANIKSLTTAVLLSSKLSAYKGKQVLEYCWDLLVKKDLHLPPNFKRDQDAVNTLQTRITEELTQTRSKFKKVFKGKVNTLNKDPIFDLTTAMVAGSQTPVTLALCARMAYLRKVYAKEAGKPFWDIVDLRLLTIRQKYQNDPLEMTRFFRAILKADEEEYGGVLPSFTSSTTANDLAQDEIDDFLQVSMPADT